MDAQASPAAARPFPATPVGEGLCSSRVPRSAPFPVTPVGEGLCSSRVQVLHKHKPQ